jgi:hypothetical protein
MLSAPNTNRDRRRLPMPERPVAIHRLRARPAPRDVLYADVTMLIGDRPLRVHEAAFVLRVAENEIRRRTARGELPVTWAGAHRRVALRAVRELLDGDLLADLALDQILDGRLHAPRAPRPSQPPPPLSTIARSLG